MTVEVVVEVKGATFEVPSAATRPIETVALSSTYSKTVVPDNRTTGETDGAMAADIDGTLL